MTFLALYGFIGFAISVAVLMVYFDTLFMTINMLARHDGMEFGPMEFLVMFTLFSIVAWPFLLFEMRK